MERRRVKRLAVPAAVLAIFWALGITLWRLSGFIQPVVLFGYLGTALGGGLGLYALLPRRQRPLGRRLTLLLVGLFLVGLLPLMNQENIQLEGVFFGLLGGVIQAAVIHYLIAKIISPLIFGRLWCGWACWTAMILDLLPYNRSKGRLPGRWGWLRYAHVLVSLGLVLGLWYGLGVRGGSTGRTALMWFIGGNLLYYALGIGLAIALKDNRAFCKYVCPVSVPLKLGSRFALLRVAGDAERCNGCQACAAVCPMDIRLTDYIASGQRVLSTECILCQTCISVCPQEALKLSFGLDAGGQEHLRQRGEPLRIKLQEP